MPLPLPLLLTLLGTTTAFSLPRQTSPPCTRPSLLLAADAYLASQTTGTLAALTPFLASNWTYEQNNSPLTPTVPSSVLTTPLVISHRRTTIDTLACASYTELISLTGAGFVIGTQIRHAPSSGAVVLIDSVASTAGSWLFNATKTLEYVRLEGDAAWGPLPLQSRSPRDVIQAAGDAYLDLWSSSTAAARVPWGTPCARLEGGAYTGKGRADDSCKAGIPSNYNQAPNTRRRYVIDEEVGSVSILCVWEHMMMAADSHEFRLEGGKLRFVHTMTECGGRTCKL